jgi:hypothetical protein
VLSKNPVWSSVIEQSVIVELPSFVIFTVYGTGVSAGSFGGADLSTVIPAV